MSPDVEDTIMSEDNYMGEDNCMGEGNRERMIRSAERAAVFLKAISHEGRLLILCHLVDGEKSVSELEDLLSARQAAVSQQLARLRYEGLVTTRREGKTIHYRLSDERPRQILELLHDMFCRETDVPDGAA